MEVGKDEHGCPKYECHMLGCPLMQCAPGTQKVEVGKGDGRCAEYDCVTEEEAKLREIRSMSLINGTIQVY